MQDIRILTLFKQHYMQTYEVCLGSEFSCWGSTDGMDVEALPKDASLSIPSMWEAIGRKQDEVDGGWSSQSIGLLRGASDEESVRVKDNFWKEKKTLPFFAVAFLKLCNKMEYGKVAKEIEKKFNKFDLRRQKDKKCNVVSYTSFENVDLVLLLNSNNLNYMGQCLQDIMSDKNIQYLYPIVSVSNKYLEFCNKNRQSMNFWKGTRCFVDEPIKKIILKLRIAGKPNVVNYIKGMISKELDTVDKVKYSLGFSDDCLVIEIPDTDVRTLLSFSFPTGLVTHQNVLYGKHIYNIETIFAMKHCSMSGLESMYPEKPKGDKCQSWCRKQLTIYKRKLTKIQEQGDNSLTCYYQAIIQCLNSLVQYEQYDLAREVFYLIYPTVDMFSRLLEQAEVKLKENYGLRNNGMKQTIQRFVDSINSVMYHTLSSGQSLFMIPGQGSVSFTVPIKLILMYLWVIKQVAYVLNDCGYEYQCILTTEMEARPVTTLLDFNMDNDNRLICVRTANRLLFWPKNLMIILSHEIGHYIGKDIRNRILRAKCVIRTLSYALAEAVFPLTYQGDCFNDQQNEIFICLKENIGYYLRNRAVKFLSKEIPYSETTKEYYAKQLEPELYRLCQMFLRELCDEWTDELPDVFYQAVEMAEKQEGDFKQKLQYIFKVYGTLKDNIHHHMAANTFQQVVGKVIKVYQECFSDIAAYAILNFSVEDFEETFRVSEGIKKESTPTTDEQVVREYIIRNLTKEPKDAFLQKDMNSSNCRSKEIPLADQIYHFVWCRMSLLEYAKSCYESMKKHIEKTDFASEIKSLQEHFVKFGDKQHKGNIYADVLSKADEYIKSIEGHYLENKEVIVDKNTKEV